MTEETTTQPGRSRRLGPMRLAIGAAQGIAAWLLLELVPSQRVHADGRTTPDLSWSTQHPAAFAALALVTAFVPVVALAELGRMRSRRLGIYLVATVAALVLLTLHDIARDPFDNGTNPRFWPSAMLVFCGGIMLFIVNQLLEFRESGERFYTHYALHFEESWMRGFQFVLSLVFVGLVWLVLLLGAALFDLIHISALSTLLERNWFRCPILGMAFAASVHITDVRPALLRGMRNLGLTLLGALLPLVTGLAAAFLVAILFVGVEPLWQTRRAASLLLTAVAVMIALLNAAYKDGNPADTPPAILRWAARLAGPVMLVLALLALWAILLRVGQYGWTAQRVRSFATALMALVYGGGYAWASIDRRSWLKRLERVNVSASFAVLAVLGALLTPLADPDRIAVASQVARLRAGKVAPARFDYVLLRFRTGRSGTDALATLAKDPNADIAARARRALAWTGDTFAFDGEPDQTSTEAPFSHATIYPKGAALPDDFRVKDWQETPTYDAACLRDGTPCEIFVLQDPAPALALPGPAQALVVHRTGGPVAEDSAAVYSRDRSGQWHRTGTLGNLRCPAAIEALRQGKVAPVRPQFDDLMAGGVRLEMTPLREADSDPCAAPAPVPLPSPAPASGLSDASAPARLGPAFGNPAPG